MILLPVQRLVEIRTDDSLLRLRLYVREGSFCCTVYICVDWDGLCLIMICTVVFAAL